MRILLARYRSTEEFLERYLSSFEHGGLFHPTREAIPLGEYVVVDVRLPTLRDQMLVRGMIAWRRPGRRRTGVRAGVGIEFLAGEAPKARYLMSLASAEGDDVVGQRRFRRLPTEIEVDWRVPEAPTRRLSRLDDIGPGGAFIRTRETQPLGTPVVLEVVPPGSTAPLAIEGRVAWLSERPGSEGLGVQFRWRDSGGLRRLKELVRRIEHVDG
jgi:Tfp pilus assembly protein PilZ